MCYSAVYLFLAQSLTLPCFWGAARSHSPQDHSMSSIITPATKRVLSAMLQVTHSYLLKPDSSKLFHINWVSLGRCVCLWNDSLQSLSQSDCGHKCIQRWLYSKLSLLHCIYHPQQFLSFSSISVIPQSHNDPKRKKKQSPVRQKEIVINNTTSISQLLSELRHSESSRASTEGG